MKRIYTVDNGAGGKVYVEASSPTGAINRLARKRFTAKPTSSTELFKAIQDNRPIITEAWPEPTPAPTAEPEPPAS